MIPLRFGAETSRRSREAALEVARDPEAGEHAAERGRLEQHEDELERGVAAGEVEPGTWRSRESPPANAMKFISGNSIGGRKSDGFLSSTVICR